MTDQAPRTEDGLETSPARAAQGSGGGRTFTIVAIAVSLVVVAAAGAGVLVLASGGSHDPAMRVAPGGVMRLDDVPEATAAHYRFAAAHPRAYMAVPCFCGCDAMLEHRYLLDCFVRADGRGWEAHASGCEVCIRESQMIRSMLADGASVAQVRAAVVAEYTMDATG